MNVEMSQTIGEIAKALSSAASEMGNISKDKRASVKSDKGSYTYTYADLATVLEEVRPVLSKHGLAVYQAASNGDKGACVTTMLLHTSGEYLSSSLTLPVTQGTPQAFGSAISYARRYALLAALGLATEDDDGESAGKPTPRTQQTQAALPSPRVATLTEEQATRLSTTLADLGWAGPSQLGQVSRLLERPVQALTDLTADEGKRVYTHAKASN